MGGFRTGRGWSLGSQLDKVVLDPGCTDHWKSFLKNPDPGLDPERFGFRGSEPREGGNEESVCLKHSLGVALSYCDKPVKRTRPQSGEAEEETDWSEAAP